MDTFLKIQSIFFSGSNAFRGDQESINEIAFLVDEEYLVLNRICVGTKEKYFNILDSVLDNEHKHDLAAGGGKNHVALKLLASEYLKNKNIQETKYEHPFCGYYPDVMSNDKSVIVECGHTQNPEKMLAYFHQGNIKEFIQIPYPVHEDDKIIGYSFTAKDDLRSFLDFRDIQNISQIKNIKNSRKI